MGPTSDQAAAMWHYFACQKLTRDYWEIKRERERERALLWHNGGNWKSEKTWTAESGFQNVAFKSNQLTLCVGILIIM